MTYRFVKAEAHHVEEMVERIAPDVAKEMEILRGENIHKSVASCIRNSNEAWAAYFDDKLICLFGVRKQSVLGRASCPWLITSYDINQHTRALLKGARIAMRYWMKQYPHLENYIPASLPRLVRFVEKIGFTVYPPFPVGRNNARLHRIEMTK